MRREGSNLEAIGVNGDEGEGDNGEQTTRVGSRLSRAQTTLSRTLNKRAKIGANTKKVSITPMNWKRLLDHAI